MKNVVIIGEISNPIQILLIPPPIIKPIEKEDLKIIRPNNGMSPKFYFKIIGKRAVKNLKAGNPLKNNDVH